jgi:site-specific recombinase XerD
MPSHPFRWSPEFSRPWPDPRRRRSPRAKRGSNGALIRRYLKIRSTRLVPSTLREYRRDITHFGQSLPAPRTLYTARPENVAAWFIANMRVGNVPGDERPWSVRTARRRRVSLYWFYEWARWDGLMVRNPVEFVELPPEYRRVPPPVSLGTVERIFSHIETRIAEHEPTQWRQYVLDAAVLRLLDRLALRASEAAHLRMSQLSTVEGELRVWVHKKGNKNRTYPITGIVGENFGRWLAVRDTIAPFPGHDDFVFLNPISGQCVSRRSLWIRLQRLAKEMSLDAMDVRLLNPTALRRNRARAMLRDGWHINSVQSVMDHGSIRTTQIYLEDTEDARMETLRAVSMSSPLPTPAILQPPWQPMEASPPRRAPDDL